MTLSLLRAWSSCTRPPGQWRPNRKVSPYPIPAAHPDRSVGCFAIVLRKRSGRSLFFRRTTDIRFAPLTDRRTSCRDEKVGERYDMEAVRHQAASPARAHPTPSLGLAMRLMSYRCLGRNRLSIFNEDERQPIDHCIPPEFSELNHHTPSIQGIRHSFDEGACFEAIKQPHRSGRTFPRGDD